MRLLAGACVKAVDHPRQKRSLFRIRTAVNPVSQFCVAVDVLNAALRDVLCLLLIYALAAC